jgi:hypothetical protein
MEIFESQQVGRNLELKPLFLSQVENLHLDRGVIQQSIYDGIREDNGPTLDPGRNNVGNFQHVPKSFLFMPWVLHIRDDGP